MRTEPLEKPHEAFLNIGLTLARKMAYYTLRALDNAHRTLNLDIQAHKGEHLDFKNQYNQGYKVSDVETQINQETSPDSSLKKILGAALVPASVVMGIGAIGMVVGASILRAGAAGILKSANCSRKFDNNSANTSRLSDS